MPSQHWLIFLKVYISGRMIRKKNYPSIRNKLWGGTLWSPSYFAASCGGAPVEIIRQYIEQRQRLIRSSLKSEPYISVLKDEVLRRY